MKVTPETGSCRSVRGGGLWAALMLLLTLTSWAAVSAGGDQDNLVLDLLPDYLAYTPSHWGDSVIPSIVPFVEYDQIPLPSSLFGDATSYFSNCNANFGDIRGDGIFYNDLGIDENLIRRSDYTPLPGYYYTWLNMSQHVGGGRHTLWQTNDLDNNIAEHIEANNDHARQWIWEPQPLALNTQQLRPHPPERLAGTEFLPVGVPVLENMDGMNLAGPLNGYWRGVTISNPDITHDYDLFLYPPSTGIGNGFDSNYLASSVLGGPSTEAIIINLNHASYLGYDVGILNWNNASSDYQLRYLDSSIILPGQTISGTMAENQVLQLIELNLWIPPAGVVTLDLQCNTNQYVQLLAFNHDFTIGATYNATYTGLVEPDGRMLIEINSPEQGYYGIAIFRDAYEGTDAFNYTLKVWAPTSDLAMVTLPDSHAPLIPRNNDNIYPGNPVPAPSILDGDMTNTVFYWHMANLGSAETPLFNNAVNLDGVSLIDSEWPYGGLPADPGLIYTGVTQAVNIPGGRHTTGMMLDSQNSISEVYENNNHYAEQWVWNPTHLAPEGSITRTSPPDRYGGWDRVADGTTLYDNVDGLRTQTFTRGPGVSDGYWGAVALLPDDDADFDIRLYSPTTGPKNGFDTIVKQSEYGGSKSEFVLIDFDGPNSWNQAWDAGALRYSGDSNYALQNTRSLLINSGDGLVFPSTFGTFAIAPGEVISLIEFTTNNYIGDVSFVLDIVHQGGDADYGVKVFSRNDPTGFYNKWESTALDETGGPGVDRTLELTLSSPEYYGLVIYKLDHNDLDKNLQFDVRFRSTALSSTPEEQGLPSASRIEGIYPNPFNPQTTIRLGMKQSGHASVNVYDVQGRLVRTLVEGELSAGRHDLSWTGVDNAGRSVPSGVYFVRVVHPDGVDQQRMSLVK